MQNADDIKSILYTLYQDECDAVGPSNVDDIVAGKSEFSEPADGHRLQIAEIIEILANAATFISGAILVGQTLQSRQSRPPTPEELAATLDRLPEDEKMKIVRAVCDNLGLKVSKKT